MARISIYCGLMLMAGAVVWNSAGHFVNLTIGALEAPPPAVSETAQRAQNDAATLGGQVVRRAWMVRTNDDWIERVNSGSHWNDRGSSSGNDNSSRMSLGRWRDDGNDDNEGGSRRYRDDSRDNSSDGSPEVEVTGDGAEFYTGGGETYRTVCVRSCDGYFSPVSFSTTKENFERDAEICQNRCSNAKLYIYKNPQETPEQMIDLSGQPYAETKTAFLFKTTYQAACTCKPQPWQQASLDRHKLYRLQDGLSAHSRKQRRAAREKLKQHKRDVAARAAAEKRALAAAQRAKMLQTAQLGLPFTPEGADNVIVLPVRNPQRQLAKDLRRFNRDMRTALLGSITVTSYLPRMAAHVARELQVQIAGSGGMASAVSVTIAGISTLPGVILPVKSPARLRRMAAAAESPETKARTTMSGGRLVQTSTRTAIGLPAGSGSIAHGLPQNRRNTGQAQISLASTAPMALGRPPRRTEPSGPPRASYSSRTRADATDWRRGIFSND